MTAAPQDPIRFWGFKPEVVAELTRRLAAHPGARVESYFPDPNRLYLPDKALLRVVVPEGETASWDTTNPEVDFLDESFPCPPWCP